METILLLDLLETWATPRNPVKTFIFLKFWGIFLANKKKNSYLCSKSITIHFFY